MPKKFFFFQSWDAFFRNANSGAAPGTAYSSPPSLSEPKPNTLPLASLAPSLGVASTGEVSEKTIDDHLAVQGIIRAYQVILDQFR